MMSDNGKEAKPGFMDIVKSTLAAALGVQSNRNRERDFKHGNLKVYIVSGIVFTVVFIALVMTVVKLVLKSAGM